jgi:hypothetical protein
MNGPGSFYNGALDKLLFMAGNDWANSEPILDANGKETGIRLYNVGASDMEGFHCGIVPITTETVLRTTFAAREGITEAPWKKTVAIGKKTQGVSAVLGFYSHELLARKNENSTDCDWELVFYNVEPTKTRSPLSPENMARNFLDLPGGTKQDYTARQFAESIVFYATHARLAE